MKFLIKMNFNRTSSKIDFYQFPLKIVLKKKVFGKLRLKCFKMNREGRVNSDLYLLQCFILLANSLCDSKHPIPAEQILFEYSILCSSAMTLARKSENPQTKFAEHFSVLNYFFFLESAPSEIFEV